MKANDSVASSLTTAILEVLVGALEVSVIGCSSMDHFGCSFDYYSEGGTR